ncbi:MAG: ATP-binding protein [Candidatus Thermoplasmatota archaeon]
MLRAAASPVAVGGAIAAVSLLLGGFLAFDVAGQAGLVSTAFVVLASGAASVVVLGRARRAPRLPWLLLGLGLVCWFVGESYWMVVDVLAHGTVPLVSVADVPYYAGYAFFVVALAAFFPSSGGRERLRRAVDVVVMATAVLAIAWVLILRGVVEAGGATPAQAFTAIAYPALDLALLAAFLLLASEANPGARASLGFLAAGAAAFVLGDLAYAWTGVVAGYDAGAPLDAAWVAGYAFLAAAAWHRAPAAEVRSGPRPLASTLAISIPVGILLPVAAVDYAQHRTLDGPLFALGFGMVVALTLRQALLFADLRRHARLLLETQAVARVGSWEVDLVSGLYHGTPETCRLYGVQPRDSMTMDEALANVHPDDLRQIHETTPSLVSGTRLQREIRVLLPTGLRWLEVTFQTNKDASGKVTRLVGLSQDITDRKQAEQAQRRLLEKERETARFKDISEFKTQFLNNAAHELATPLTPLKLQMATLRARDDHTPRDLAALELLDRNINRLDILVVDLLDAARLQSGRLRMRISDVDVTTLTAHLQASFEDQARKAGVTFGLKAATPGLRLECDETRLEQVLYNLVNNAMKFTPHGGQVWLKTERVGSQAVFAVSDTGIGLTPQQMALLFQPFSQVHDSDKVRVGGTGLGLYIARGIVQQHGGTIDVASEGPGLGTTFTIRLPLKVAIADSGNPAGVPVRTTA